MHSTSSAANETQRDMARGAALFNVLSQMGLISATPEAVGLMNRLLEEQLVRFGRAGMYNTNGEVLQHSPIEELRGLACKNPRPNYLMICSKIRNQVPMSSWAIMTAGWTGSHEFCLLALLRHP